LFGTLNFGFSCPIKIFVLKSEGKKFIERLKLKCLMTIAWRHNDSKLANGEVLLQEWDNDIEDKEEVAAIAFEFSLAIV
jgi:hypothetical protein